ncbi:MAG TPA: methyltransferase domain-containing protein [Azospirillaceae bacterium]|nr:methyltransferase domain-containing protein [Azospirillaceae bacterium]
MVDRDDERARWQASAGAWDRWADPIARLADKLNQPLLDAAGVCSGDRVLDLACGVGEPALSAARRAGSDGLVVATDLVPAMLHGAARRARTETAALATAAADMAALPFPEGSFDRVTCRFGVMFVADLQAALSEVVRVLRPGGRFAAMVWGPAADNTAFAVATEAAVRVFGPGAVRDMATPFRFAAAGSLEPWLRAAGFVEVDAFALTPTGKADAATNFWRPNLEMLLARLLVEATPGQRAALEAEVARLYRMRAVNGIVALNVHARICTAERSGPQPRYRA